MKCRSGVNKVKAGQTGPGRFCAGWLGNPDRGQVFLLARHGQLHNFAIFIVLNFERGEKLETALLSLSILWENQTKQKLTKPFNWSRVNQTNYISKQQKISWSWYNQTNWSRDTRTNLELTKPSNWSLESNINQEPANHVNLHLNYRGQGTEVCKKRCIFHSPKQYLFKFLSRKNNIYHTFICRAFIQLKPCVKRMYKPYYIKSKPIYQALSSSKQKMKQNFTYKSKEHIVRAQEDDGSARLFPQCPKCTLELVSRHVQPFNRSLMVSKLT